MFINKKYLKHFLLPRLRVSILFSKSGPPHPEIEYIIAGLYEVSFPGPHVQMGSGNHAAFFQLGKVISLCR